ncbi:MAG: tRNA lysidine(34) synthetase TilS [Leptospirales bacterium]
MTEGKSSPPELEPFLPELDSFFLKHGIHPSHSQTPFTVHVGISGGADSVFLACLLSRFLPTQHPLVLLHFNHLTRGSEHAPEIRFLEALAQSLGRELRVGTLDEPLLTAKMRSEDVLRTQRYAFFQAVLEESSGNILFLAHNQDDLVETILMNLFRGTGPTGLLGIPEVRDQRIFRPMMGIPSLSIRNALHQSGTPFLEDPSNRNPVFLRNRVRHELVPMIRKIFPPEGDHHLSRLASLLKKEFTAPDSPSWMENILTFQTPDRIAFPISRYQKLSPYRQSLLLRSVLNSISDTGTPVPEERNLLKSLAQSPVHEGPMGQGWILRIEFQEVHLVYKGSQNSFHSGQWELSFDTQRVDQLRRAPGSEAILALPTGDRLLFRWETETHKWSQWEKGRLSSRQCLIPPEICLNGKPALRVTDSGPRMDLFLSPAKKGSISRIISKKRFPPSIRRNLPILSQETLVLWIPYALPFQYGKGPESAQLNEGLSIIFEERRGNPWKRFLGNP